VTRVAFPGSLVTGALLLATVADEPSERWAYLV
jgi:hypothetical protein